MDESLRDRQEYLFILVDNLILERDNWADNPNQLGLPIGGPLWMAAEDCCQAYAVGTIPAACRKILTEVERFTHYWIDHCSKAEVSPVDDLLPGNNVWSALESIKAAREGSKPRTRKPIEMVADLVVQKVTDIQIAKIYDWVDEFGHPDLRKVREAKLHPGLYDGAAHDKLMAEQDQQELHQDRMKAEQAIAKAMTREPRRPQPGPESIEMLVSQGLTAAQISKLKVMPVEQVILYCRENRVQLAGQAALPPEDEPETAETEEEVEQETFDQGMLSIEQQILFANDNDPDAKPKVLAELLGCSTQKVVAVLKRRSEVEEPV